MVYIRFVLYYLILLNVSCASIPYKRMVSDNYIFFEPHNSLKGEFVVGIIEGTQFGKDTSDKNVRGEILEYVLKDKCPNGVRWSEKRFNTKDHSSKSANGKDEDIYAWACAVTCLKPNE